MKGGSILKRIFEAGQVNWNLNNLTSKRGKVGIGSTSLAKIDTWTFIGAIGMEFSKDTDLIFGGGIDGDVRGFASDHLSHGGTRTSAAIMAMACHGKFRIAQSELDSSTIALSSSGFELRLLVLGGFFFVVSGHGANCTDRGWCWTMTTMNMLL